MPRTDSVESSPTLLGIPPELRNRIYRLVLVADSPLDPTRSATHKRAAFLAVNNQIHDEAAGIFYTENTFVLDLTLRNVDSAIDWARSLDPEDGKLIETFAVNFHGGWTRKSAGLIHLFARSRNVWEEMRELEDSLLKAYKMKGSRLAHALIKAGVNSEHITVIGSGRTSDDVMWARLGFGNAMHMHLEQATVAGN